MRSAAVLALTVLLLALAAIGQNVAVVPKSEETVEVSIVNIDVVVTDKKGNRIRGLKPEDFEILEDGKPQAVSNFAEYGGAPAENVAGEAKVDVDAPAAPPQPQVAARQRRTIVILFDHFSLAEFRKGPVFASLKKLLRDVVQPGDAVMVAKWRYRMNVRQDFTDDLAAVDRALDAIEKESTGIVWDAAAQLRERQAALAEFAQDLSQGPLGGQGIDIESAVRLEAEMLARAEHHETKNKVDAINAMVASLAGYEGKKAMVLLTHRLGRISGYEYLAITPSPRTRNLQRGGRLPASWMGEDEIRKMNAEEILRSLTRKANAHGVTIYPLYPEGLRMTYESSPSLRGPQAMAMADRQRQGNDFLVLRNEIEGLTQVAKETGGVAAWGTTNITDIMPRVIEDFESYYSLAYRLPARNDDQPRKVVVKAKNRAWTVRARQESIERSPQTRMTDQVTAHLVRDPEGSIIPVTMTLGTPLQKERRLYAIPVTVRIPVSSLTLMEEGQTRRGAFSVYVGSMRILGQPPAMTRQTVAFTAADVAAAKDQHFNYTFDLLTDLTTHRLSVGVIDEVSRDTGFAVIDLTRKAS